MPDRIRPLLPLLVAAVLLCLPARAQDTTELPTAPDSSQQEYSRRLQQLESDTDLTSTEKSKAVDAMKQAIAEATAFATLQAQAENYRTQIDAIGSSIQQAQQQLAASDDTPPIVTDNVTLDELDSRVRQKNAEVENLQQDLSAKVATINAREQRLLQLPNAIAEANQRLSDVERELTADAEAESNPRVRAAQTTWREQRRDTIRQEIETLKLENAWEVARGELLNLQRDAAKRKVTLAQQELARWEEAARRKRETEVDRHIRMAAEYVTKFGTPLDRIAKENQVLAERRSKVKGSLDTATSMLERVENLVKKLVQEFERARAEAEATEGISRGLGEVLREKRSELRSVADIPGRDALGMEEAADVRLQLFLLRETESDLSELDRATREVMDEQGLASEHQNNVRELLSFRRSLIEGLRTDTDTLFQVLAKLEGAEKRLKTTATDYATFIDERVLWVRSTSAVSLQTAQEFAAVGKAWSDPQAWLSLAAELGQGVRSRPLVPLAVLFVCLPAFVLAFPIRQRIREVGDKASVGSCRNFSLTLRASLQTIAVSIILPASLFLVGRWIQASDLEHAASLGAFFITAAMVWLPLEFWRQSARPKGLMECHFGVARKVTEIIRSQLRWLIPFLVPAIALSEAIRVGGNPVHEQTMGRFAFCCSMILVLCFIYRIAHPTNGALQGYFAKHADSYLFRMRHFLFSVVLAIPILLAALSIVGYHFTASQLAERLLLTSFLLLGFWLVNALALRWVVISRRRLAMEQARARLAKVTESESNPQTAEAHANLEEIDLSSVDQQTRRLVRALTFVALAIAIWSLWVDVLPALSRFDDIKAWDVQVTAAATPADPSSTGTPESAPTAIVRVVSLADVAKAIAIFIAMLLAMRDLPGLLELVLLQRLPLDNALRFAISTLTRYVIFIVGTAWALNCIEIGWSKVQWLVAGVSVGLGFGLQEIFANFVSGLIILFERPLRAGDIVTIDDVTGTVKSVRMRATIIQDLDRKDFVVPNKDFITGRLLNWTLSDEVSRIVVRVGVAYGSDTAKAKQIMLKAAQDNREVLNEPPPQVTFEEFGDSSLNLVLRCFISLQNMPRRLGIVDELHSQIDQNFRAASIEIPFPQRDLHLRSSDIAATTDFLEHRPSP